MNIQLSGGLGDVQAVLKELVDGLQGLLVELVGVLALEDFADEHSAERNRQLINQAADAQAVVRHDFLAAVEDFPDVQGHFRFFVGARNFLDLVDDGAVGDADVLDFRRVQAVQELLRGAVQVLVAFFVLQFADKDDVAAIDRGHKIAVFAGEEAAHGLEDVDVAVVPGLDEEHGAAHVGLDVQLLRAVVDIHQEEVVQQEVLHEVVLVEALLVGGQQVLHLEGRELPDHVDVLAGALGEQHILQLTFVKDLEKLTSVDHLGVRRGIREGEGGGFVSFRALERCCQDLSVRIGDAKLNSGDAFQTVQRSLQNRI